MALSLSISVNARESNPCQGKREIRWIFVRLTRAYAHWLPADYFYTRHSDYLAALTYRYLRYDITRALRSLIPQVLNAFLEKLASASSTGDTDIDRVILKESRQLIIFPSILDRKYNAFFYYHMIIDSIKLCCLFLSAMQIDIC